MNFGGFRSMWIITMFDLPTDTKAAKRSYTDFRKALLNGGFVMLQYSVYARHCPSNENAAAHQDRVKMFLPDDGEVRIITITDKQFERMKVFFGRVRKATEQAPEQLTFF